MANTIQPLYLSYKENTKYALSWLSSTCRLKQASFNSTEEILRAAEKLQAQNCAVPRAVISALSDAITTRWKVLGIYNSLPTSSDCSGDNDRKHEAFIKRLEKVLRILQPLESKFAPVRPSPPPRIKTATSESASNRFSALDISDTSCEPGEYAVEPEKKASMTEECETLDRSLPLPPQEILLQDDDIGEWIELSYFLYELDTICQQVNIYWQEAAKRQIPIPVAAWLSTTALHAVSRISARLKTHTPTYDILMRKWLVHKGKGVKIRFTHMPELKCQAGGRFADDCALLHIGQILEHCRSAEEYQNILPDAGKYQNPFSIIHQPMTSGDTMGSTFDADDIALDQMQESMRQLLASKRAIAELEISPEDHYISEPLLPLMRQILNNTDAPIPIHLVFGMEMLLSTYKAFLWPDGEANRRNCRVEALQFANEVCSSISAVLSTIDSIGNDTASIVETELILQLRAESLKEYAREKRFDLYFQAPWTAGCHMNEILDVAFSDGLRLCCETGYVCAVLHLYNSLRQLDTPISQIVLLDQLCQLFLVPLFIGTLPTENFSSHFRRALGRKGKKKKEDSNMDISRLSKATPTSTRRVAPSELSVFYHLHGSYYQTTPELWVRIYVDPAIQRPSQSQIRETINSVHSVPFNIPLDKMKTCVLSEFNSEIPVMRIDFFAVFRFCLDLLQDLGETLNRHPGISAKGKDVPLGFAWVDQILDQIVGHVNDDFKRRMMPHWRQLNVTKTIFTKLEGSKSISDFLWNI